MMPPDDTTAFVHDEPCEICGENAQKFNRPTRSVSLTYGHFHVCELCDEKLPNEWQLEANEEGDD
jgi:hypothetical protein